MFTLILTIHSSIMLNLIKKIFSQSFRLAIHGALRGHSAEKKKKTFSFSVQKQFLPNEISYFLRPKKLSWPHTAILSREVNQLTVFEEEKIWNLAYFSLPHLDGKIVNPRFLYGPYSRDKFNLGNFLSLTGDCFI